MSESLSAAGFTFSVWLYDREHGRLPRGRGCWGFTTDPGWQPGSDSFVWFSPSMTYAAAKKHAAFAAAAAGVPYPVLYVLP